MAQSPSTVILEPKKIISDSVSTISPSIIHEVIGPDAMILGFFFFFNALLSQFFHFPFFTPIKRLYFLFAFCHWSGIICISEVVDISSGNLDFSLSPQIFTCSSFGKESACNAGDLGSIPGLWRSPGEGKGYLLQHSGLENSMDCIDNGAAKSRTQLSDFHFHFSRYRHVFV